MPAYNFKERFAKDVKNLVKRQTIRAKRKYLPRVGQTAYLFTGMRTRNCKRLGEYPVRSVDDIIILEYSFEHGVKINDKFIKGGNLTRLARADGFKNFGEMYDFFLKVHGIPFKGDLIKW